MKKGRIFPIKIKSSVFSDRTYIILVGKGASDQVGKLPAKEILGLVVGRWRVISLRDAVGEI